MSIQDSELTPFERQVLAEMQAKLDAFIGPPKDNPYWRHMRRQKVIDAILNEAQGE